MDALMAMFVAALLTQASDRNAWFVAILADRYQKPGLVIVAVTLVVVTGNALAATAGAFMAPIMTPNARALFLCLALVSAGSSALFALKRPAVMEKWRGGAFLAAIIGFLAIGLGDRTQFLTAAIAARGSMPAFAAIGATLGSLAILIPAALAGEAARATAPMRAIGFAIGLTLILAGLIAGLSAMRLI